MRELILNRKTEAEALAQFLKQCFVYVARPLSLDDSTDSRSAVRFGQLSRSITIGIDDLVSGTTSGSR